MMTLICIKQHLNKICSSILAKKLSKTEAELKKSVAYKKSAHMLKVISKT